MSVKNNFLPKNLDLERLSRTPRGLLTLLAYFAQMWRMENIVKLQRGELLFYMETLLDKIEFTKFWARAGLMEGQMRFLITLYRDFGFLGKVINNIDEAGLHFLCRVGTKRALRLEVAALANRGRKVKASEIRELWRKHNPGKKLKGFARRSKNIVARLYSRGNVEGAMFMMPINKDTRKLFKKLLLKRGNNYSLLCQMAKMQGSTGEVKAIAMKGDEELMAVS